MIECVAKMKRTYLKRYLSTGIFSLLLIITVSAAIPLYSKLTETIRTGISGFRTELEQHFGLSFSYKRLSPSIFNGFRIKGIEVSDFNDGKKIILIKSYKTMEEFVKLIEQILYMENFNTEVTTDLKERFVELYNSYGNNVPDKYRGDVNRMYNKYAATSQVSSNAFSFSY